MWPAVASIMPATGRVLYMRSWMVGLVAGSVIATRLPWLVPGGLLLLLAVGSLALRNRAGVTLLGLVTGCALVSFQGHDVLQQRLADECTGTRFDIQGRVVSLPRISVLDAQRRRQRFEFELDHLAPQRCAGPRRVLLSWYGEEDIQPGQSWRFQARLRRPWGLANEGSFNIQAWYVLTRIDAVGSAREQGAALLADSDGWPINRWRHAVSRAIGEAGVEARAGAVLRAVTVADKSGIDHDLWSLFQRLGVNHLLVISGLHVGMVAGLGFILGGAATGALRAVGVTGRYGAELTAVALALLYTALAGFSVATQRALFMLLCFILARGLSRQSRGADKLLIAAVAVLLIDPLAPLGSGFWLSFSAVAALLWLGHWYRPNGKIHGVLGAHLYMGLLMLPVGGFWFGGGSWLSAPANLLMVPLVGLFVVPLSLVGVALFALGLPGASGLWQLAAMPLELLFSRIAVPLGDTGFLNLQADPGTTSLAALALAVLVLPGGAWRKWLLIICWLPLVLPLNDVPEAPVLHVLDVGQGTAVVFRDGDRALLYDTGGGNPSGANLAQSVVLPFLHSRGIGVLDSLIVSHGDLDHSAGLGTILESLPVATIWLGGGQQTVPGARDCRAGLAWRWSERVSFQFLSPAAVGTLSDNNASCVLSIEVGTRRLLLAGDIEESQERQLISYWQAELASDFLLVAHHGSKTSTSQSWLNRVDPQLAVVSNAYGNRFGHPAPQVLHRLESRGVRVFHSARSGALAVTLDEFASWRVTAKRAGFKPWWM